jgi:site-specific recombinase XerD
MSSLAPTLQSFFTDRLVRQRQASPRTVAAYRDTFRLLLRFLHVQTGKPPYTLGLEDLNASVVGAFLDDLEVDRHNTPRTRNARLAAVRSLFRYAAPRHPEQAALIQRVLSIPQKRYDRAIVSFLIPSEIHALFTAPDRTRWEGRRDHALLVVAVQTGLRVSELIGLNCGDLILGRGAHVRCTGKDARSG